MVGADDYLSDLLVFANMTGQAIANAGVFAETQVEAYGMALPLTNPYNNPEDGAAVLNIASAAGQASNFAGIFTQACRQASFVLHVI